MKEVNKGILDNDMVISAENIQKMGEVIALTCIKTVIVRSGKDLHYLYKGLLRDINRSKEDYSPFSNAYDIAQEAMLFLCQHIGKKLGDNYTTKYGKVVTIKSACYRCADNYLQKQSIKIIDACFLTIIANFSAKIKGKYYFIVVRFYRALF